MKHTDLYKRGVDSIHYKEDGRLRRLIEGPHVNLSLSSSRLIIDVDPEESKVPDLYTIRLLTGFLLGTPITTQDYSVSVVDDTVTEYGTHFFYIRTSTNFKRTIVQLRYKGELIFELDKYTGEFFYTGASVSDPIFDLFMWALVTRRELNYTHPGFPYKCTVDLGQLGQGG